MGERADAFEDADDLAAAIEDLESLIDAIGEAHADVGDLTNAIPELRGSLQEFEAIEDEE
jgi:hypothetical protein